jgi:polyhydroxybutyrate depolymerase
MIQHTSRFPLLFSLLIALLLMVSCKKSKFDSEFKKLTHDGENRTYLLHVPEQYDESEATSLIIALHGGTGSAKNIEQQSRLPELSDQEGFILCSPNGLNRTWNSGWCCGKAAENNVDDVGFISKLIDELLSDYNIDPKRVYVTGMSNGAMMSYRLACELSDKIAAIAPVAGTMVSETCSPSNGVSIIHFHSYEDSNVPDEGGIGDGISDHYNTPLDSVMNIWSGFNACQENTFENRDGYDYFSFTNCSDSIEVQLFITNDGGHSWPGGTKPRNKSDETSSVLKANELMWAFFEEHAKR